jgi:arylsulfatase
MGLPAGVTVDQPVGLQDIMPTLLDAAGVPVPDSCTGESVLPLIRGESGGWRACLHGEHSKRYSEDESSHYLVDTATKYIWYSQTGAELLFDLAADPEERHNLLTEPDGEARVAPWRGRLVEALRDRPERFVEGERLVAGRPHDYLVPGRNVARPVAGGGRARAPAAAD